MKSITLLLLLLLFNFVAIGGKTYSLKIKVIGRDKNQPIAGAKVYFTIDKIQKEAGITNSSGILILNEMTAKDIDIEVSDPKGNYKNAMHYFYNKKLQDRIEEIFMRSNYLEEKRAWKALDDKYGSIESIEDEYSKDTANFIVPEPIGGTQKLMKFISENLEYPEESIEQGDQGRVMLDLIVQEDGQITHVKILKGVTEYIDDEAIRVIRKLDKMKPATYKGKTVKSRVRLPIYFSLN